MVAAAYEERLLGHAMCCTTAAAVIDVTAQAKLKKVAKEDISFNLHSSHSKPKSDHTKPVHKCC